MHGGNVVEQVMPFDRNRHECGNGRHAQSKRNFFDCHIYQQDFDGEEHAGQGNDKGLNIQVRVIDAS